MSHRASVFIGGRRAALDAQLAAAIDPQAVVAELWQVAALPVGAETYAAVWPTDLQGLEVVTVPHGAGAADEGCIGCAHAAELRQPGARCLTAAATQATDHGDARGDEGTDQPRLMEYRISGASDQRTEVVEVDAVIAAGEIRRRGVIVLEAAVRQQGAAVAGQETELAVEQEIAAVKGDVVAAVDHRRTVLPILAEDAADDVQRRQDAAVIAVREGRSIALVAAEIAVENLSLEYVPDQAAAVAATALNSDVAQAEIVEIDTAAVTFDGDAVPFPTPTEDIEAFDQDEAYRRAAVKLEHIAVVDLRVESDSVTDNAALPSEVAGALTVEHDAQRAGHTIGTGRDRQHGAAGGECAVKRPLQRRGIVGATIADGPEFGGVQHVKRRRRSRRTHRAGGAQRRAGAEESTAAERHIRLPAAIAAAAAPSAGARISTGYRGADRGRPESRPRATNPDRRAPNSLR